MNEIDLVQGSEDWRMARVGSLGASRIAEVIAKTKTGYGSGRANVMAELVCECLTGRPADRYVTAAMQIGTELEPEARALYFFKTGNMVTKVGLIRHPRIKQSHASPDGLIGDDGLIEIKCPQPAAHLETLLAQERNGVSIPAKYVTQMYWQMACTGRGWCDYVSYNPNFPDHLKLWKARVGWHEERIKELEKEVADFLFEMAATMATLNKAYPDKTA